MHESRLVADLIGEAERSAPGGGSTITSLNLHVGVLANVSEAGLRDGLTRHAFERWGTEPDVHIVVGSDPTERLAQGVVLTSIRVAG